MAPALPVSRPGASGAKAHGRKGRCSGIALRALVAGGLAWAVLQLRGLASGTFLGGGPISAGTRVAPHAEFSRRHPSRRHAADTATATDAGVETFDFQAEVGRVMDIIVNSLYSNKDVFLRELVSNAADACDKKRFLALTESDAPPEPMKLRIRTDKDARTLTIEDNGVGMTKAELIENLGRIARSGTANFVKQLGSGEADVSLIGQFGVGFYSSFLVANKVEVISRSFKDAADDRTSWKWTSEGSAFTIEAAPEEAFFGEQSGTKLVLHLREEAQEYLDSGKLADLLKKYSEFITFPIELWNEKVQYDQVVDDSAPPAKEGEKPKMKSVPRSVFEWEVMNKMKPIWLRNPDVVNESEYTEFYKTTFKAFDEPLTTTHFKVEGQIEFRALVFIPSTMPFELTRDMFSESGRAMRLYVKRVFINDKFEDLVPRWLTFARGVVDSEDLPLNVGREILQKSRTLKIIRKRVVRKVLDSIDDLREEQPEKYEQFWSSYGKYFKVGLVEDLDYKDELKRFVRFWSSRSGDNMTSLSEYVSRMKEGQDKIYFVTGEGKRAAEISPAMEMMRSKGYEVLYMVDPLDEICSQSIVDFEGKKLVDINKAGLDLEKSEEEKKEMEDTIKEFEGLATWLKKQLGERVQKVQVSERLVDSPATLVQGEWGMSPMMQRYMKSQTTSSASDSAFAIGSRNQGILEINPILEAFGNAKTGRNNNSSRFGKWIEVLVDPTSLRFQGASVTDYLLEVTRVCGQGPGERNYHIFYQLVQDASGDYDDLKLSGGVEGFEYLKANSGENAGVSDKDSFAELKKAFVGLRFSDEDQDAIFRIIAGVLHLGNVAFTPSADHAEVANKGALADAARLLGCSPEGLATCVCNKRLTIGKDVTVSPLGDDAARRARDSIAKLIYSRLFRWLVERCNGAFRALLGGEGAEEGRAFPFMGVLDIAGFESFATNSLEQLFINLSNEKLQQFFNSYVFKTELDLYSKEGIAVGAVEFADNAEILALIEGKGGVLAVLDDSTTGIRQTDATYAAQVVKAHEKHPRFVRPKFPNQPVFTIRHFAGDVLYTTTGFLEKNVAQQPPEVLEMMAKSELGVLRILAEDREAEKSGAPAARGARKATVGSAFRKSLQQLVDRFGEAGAHFIRCVKPNTAKAPGHFDGAMVMDQLRLSGVMEAVKIRKAGFPVRLPMEDFVKRYAVLVSLTLREQLLKGLGDDPAKAATDMFQALAELLESKVAGSEYAVGRSKVFMRDGLYRILEKYRRIALAGPALQIQQAWRGFRVRRVMKEVLEVYGELQRLLENTGVLDGACSLIEKQKRATVMEASLGQVDLLLERAEVLVVKLPALERMLRVRARIAAEAKLARQMQNLIQAGCVDVPEMTALLARSADYKMKGGVIDVMQERCEKLKEQLPQSRALKACVDLDLEGLQKVIDEAKDKGYDSPEKWIIPNGPALFEEALARLQQLEEEKRAFEEQARKAAAEAAALAAERKASAAAAKQVAERAAEAAKIRVTKKISQAVLELDAPALKEGLQEAGELNLPEGDLAEADSLFLSLQSGDFVQTRLTELRRGGGQEPLDLLKKSNLAKQIEVLGLKVLPLSEEMREVTNQFLQRQKSKSGRGRDPLERQVAERCFQDLANFSGLRDPRSWGGRAWRTANLADAMGSELPCSPAMLQWCPDRIPEPLTSVEASATHLALRNFSNLQRCMGDKPAAYIGDKAEPILALAKRMPALRDEIYLQVVKQLTKNPSAESALKGWQLLHSLCGCAVPSAEMAEFVKAFLLRAAGEVEAGGEDRTPPAARPSAGGRRSRTVAGVLRTYLAERPKLATGSLELLEAAAAALREEVAAGQKGPESGCLVEVYTEEDMVVSLRVPDAARLEDLKRRMAKALAMRSADGFEFFSSDPDEVRPAWRLLPRGMGVRDAVSKATVGARCLLFGRVNVTPKEDLEADDLARARLTFQHAVKQWLGYPMAPTGGHATSACVKIAAALVAADKIEYGKRKKGNRARFNKKVTQLKHDLDGGLVGEGVLERYVPSSVLKGHDRADLAKQLLEVLGRPAGNVNENARFELLGKSRALSLMQASLPDFAAYFFGPVTEVAMEETQWREVRWERAPSRMPQGALAPLEARRGKEHDLLVGHEGVELRSSEAADWSLRVPLKIGMGRWHLTGWGAFGGETLALSLFDRASPEQPLVGIALRTPEGVADAVPTALTCFCA